MGAERIVRGGTHPLRLGRSEVDLFRDRKGVIDFNSKTEIERAFATLAQRRAGGLVVVPDGFFNSRARTTRHTGGAPYDPGDILTLHDGA